MKVLFLIFLLAAAALATYMPTREPYLGKVDWSKIPRCVAEPCVCSCNGVDTLIEPKVRVAKRRNLLVGRYGFRIGKREDGSDDDDLHYPEDDISDVPEKTISV